jgi:hypothetical protein
VAARQAAAEAGQGEGARTLSNRPLMAAMRLVQILHCVQAAAQKEPGGLAHCDLAVVCTQGPPFRLQLHKSALKARASSLSSSISNQEPCGSGPCQTADLRHKWSSSPSCARLCRPRQFLLWGLRHLQHGHLASSLLAAHCGVRLVICRAAGLKHIVRWMSYGRRRRGALSKQL